MRPQTAYFRVIPVVLRHNRDLGAIFGIGTICGIDKQKNINYEVPYIQTLVNFAHKLPSTEITFNALFRMVL